MVSIIKHNRGKKDIASKMALQMRLMIVIPVLATNLLSIAIFADPFGNFFIFDYMTARVIAELSNNLSCFSDVVMIFYCVDVYNAFSKSNAMKKFTPFLIKHKLGGFIILGFSSSMVIFGGTVTFLSLRGVVGDPTNSAVLSALYAIFTKICTGIFSLILSHKIKKEVMVIAKKDAENAAKAAAEAKRKADMTMAHYKKRLKKAAETGGPVPKPPKRVVPQEVKVNPAVATTMKTRQFLLIGTFFRFTPLMGYAGAISGAMYSSPLAFGVVSWGLFSLSTIISCTVMVLLVIEITPNTRDTMGSSFTFPSRSSSILRRLSGSIADSVVESTGPSRSSVTVV